MWSPATSFFAPAERGPTRARYGVPDSLSASLPVVPGLFGTNLCLWQLGTRSTTSQCEYECLDCGFKGWSNHADLADRAGEDRWERLSVLGSKALEYIEAELARTCERPRLLDLQEVRARAFAKFVAQGAAGRTTPPGRHVARNCGRKSRGA